jgi:predicted carbohydrate-binding protein with CBM5 and CBM33 domain
VISRGVPALLAALVLTLLAPPFAGRAAAHGAPTAPTSRSAACGAEGTATATPACRAAIEVSPRLPAEWDNIRRPGVGGRDREVIPDGALCSAGIPGLAGLDLPRADWPSTELTAGTDYTFRYRATIPHAGGFRLYLTRPGYAPDRPLTWAELETDPFAEVADPRLSDGSYEFEVTLPAGVSGRHLIYTVWQNSGSPDTYYSCSDVVFTAGQAAVVPTTGGPSAPTAAAPPAAETAPDAEAPGQPAVPVSALVGGGAVAAVGVGLVGLLALRGRRR